MKTLLVVLGLIVWAQSDIGTDRAPLIGVCRVLSYQTEFRDGGPPRTTQDRIAADRMVWLHRPELYVETSKAVAADKNVVCLTGTSPRWWDTRCSRLRFDARRLEFATVV